MNPLPEEIWNRGLPYALYRERITRNQQVFDEVYENPVHTAGDLEFLRGLPGLGVLAIGEEWCPDVYQTLPTWARLAEELPGWSLRVFPRDSHPDVMDHFLWLREARRIPVYAFYDRRGHLQTWWSGRGREAQEHVDGFLKGRAFADLGREEKSRMTELLDEGYRRTFRRANLLEILALLRAFFHAS